MSDRVGVFAYGALASPSSARQTLGRRVPHTGPVRLARWRRRWSQARDNTAVEKTFARADDGTIPQFCLGLNIERAPGRGPNGCLIEVSEAELRRLTLRELRYDLVEVTDDVVVEDSLPLDRVVAFTAKPENFSEPPPRDSIIVASYVRAVEAAFAELGREQLQLFAETTGPYPVEVVEAVLVSDEIPPGNPREW